MTRPRPRALLIDMDGTLRRFDPAVVAGVEQRYGLAPGAIWTAAFDRARAVPAVLGKVTHAEWMAVVAEALGAPAAVAEWEAYRGEVDPDVLALVRAVRGSGRRVALTTNATDRLPRDLERLGLVGELDAVVNSSELGVAKPAPEYFAAACRAVGEPPDRCLLVDDSIRFVAGARAYGLPAHRWTGPADLPYLRSALTGPLED